MTLGPIQNRRARAAWLLVGGVSVLVLALAGPAIAKHHHARKPYKLWHQYPLRVKRSGEKIKPTHPSPPSPSPNVAVVATPRHIAGRDSPSSSTNVGVWLAFAVGVGLVVIGLIALRRQRPSTRGGLLHPRSEPELAPRGDLSQPATEPEPVPRGNLPQPPAEPELAPRGDLPPPPVEPELAPRGDLPPPPVELEPVTSGDLHPPAEPELVPGDNSTQSVPDGALAPARPAPETVPAPERVRLQLADGRCLEGYKRNSPSTSPHLVILDILAAFDQDGNAAPTRPSDSFILESEISSIQRIDDP
jgi:hypothetical protein